ncbi:uncharacterized protein LOC128222092 isoform X2 [Mya arenaria]|uniref:uncharacterized protein LOC128222092 isoform X2 n=1 Tax=Mya arenaria TaxID=6604 RepID=UPI0022E3F526|nr:uncharacterized protein LOC128222092 isoform X2 [Mya arenaria]
MDRVELFFLILIGVRFFSCVQTSKNANIKRFNEEIENLTKERCAFLDYILAQDKEIQKARRSSQVANLMNLIWDRCAVLDYIRAQDKEIQKDRLSSENVNLIWERCAHLYYIRAQDEEIQKARMDPELFLLILFNVWTFCAFTWPWVQSSKEADLSSTYLKNNKSRQKQRDMFERKNATIVKMIEEQRAALNKARDKEISMQKDIDRQKHECNGLRDKQKSLKKVIEQLEKECHGLRKSSNLRRTALIKKQSELDKRKKELLSLQATIKEKDECLRKYYDALSELKLEISDMEKELKLQTERHNEELGQISTLKEEKEKYMEGTANKQDEYCCLHVWHDSHASLETPTGTYISIHPPHSTLFSTNVKSLKEDIKHLQKIPSSNIPLFGLNVDAIDEWYKTIVYPEQLRDHYWMLATALTKGSVFFENEFATFADKDYTYNNATIFCAADEYAKQQFSLTTI